MNKKKEKCGSRVYLDIDYTWDIGEFPNAILIPQIYFWYQGYRFDFYLN